MKAVTFEDLYAGVKEDNEPKEKTRKAPVEVEIEVAGPKESTSKKTIEFHTNNFGMMDIKFKQGGELPRELRGNFTDLNAALSAVNSWKNRAGKEAKVVETVKHEDKGSKAPDPDQTNTNKETLSLKK